MNRPQTFQEFCLQFTNREIPAVKIGKRYFYDPNNLLKVAQDHKWDVFSVGLYLGEEKREFIPTSALIDMLAHENPNRVSVGSKAAWLFVCNRDILMDGVLDAGHFNVNSLVFVQDHNDNVLGYGRVVGLYNSTMRNKTYVKHAFDRGEYLRREK